MTSFFQRIEHRAEKINSLLCVGLDPHPNDLREKTGAAAKAFCLDIVAETKEYAVAYKPNAAFFEAFGPEGWQALKDLIMAIPDDIPVLLDAKRGDIASTAEAYARSAFDLLSADALTINPYLGQDSITPFTQNPEKGVFLLCKTSNPGATDLQDLNLKGTDITLYEHIAHLAQNWNQNQNVGLVVGATQVEALAKTRAQAPTLWFLTPGVGAQGADLSAALQAGLRPDGLGILLPVSRGISRAESPKKAAQEIRDEINRARAAFQPAPTLTPPSQENKLADALLAINCVRFGSFTLKSGLQSPIYIDLRRLAAHPEVLAQVAAAYLPILKKLSFQQLAALPYAALPITTAISLQGGWPMLYPRKEVKTYGTKAQIEGVFDPGEQAVVIDDLITTGGSKIEGIEILTAAGLTIKDIVVLIDRQSGGAEDLAKRGYQLHAVFKLTDLLDYWERSNQVPSEQIAAARDFLNQTG